MPLNCVNVSVTYLQCNSFSKAKSGESFKPTAMPYSCITEHVKIPCSVLPHTHFETDFKLVVKCHGVAV